MLFSTFAVSQTGDGRAELQAQADAACEAALAANTLEALSEFRQRFAVYRTACTALAFNPVTDDYSNGGPPISIIGETPANGGAGNQGGSDQGGYSPLAPAW